MAAEKFNGTWKIVESQKFDDYMKAIGKLFCSYIQEF